MILVTRCKVKSKEKLYFFPSDVQKTEMGLNSWVLSFERRKVYFSLLPKVFTLHHQGLMRVLLIVSLTYSKIVSIYKSYL